MSSNRRMMTAPAGGRRGVNFNSNSTTLPADAARLIARWRQLGGPAIELEPGVIVTNLERWLYNNPPATPARLGRVREYLYIDTLAAAEGQAA